MSRKLTKNNDDRTTFFSFIEYTYFREDYNPLNYKCNGLNVDVIKKSIIEDYNLLQTYRNKIDGYKPLKSQF